MTMPRSHHADPREHRVLGSTVLRSDRIAAPVARTKSSALVDLVLKEIVDTIARCEMVKLSSFGAFTVRKKGQRIGRNPKTGVEAPIFPRRAVVFKASAIMKRKIQKDKSDAPSGTTRPNCGTVDAEQVS